MMVLSALRPDASLSEFLAHRARSASVRRLAIDAVIGGAAWGAEGLPRLPALFGMISSMVKGALAVVDSFVVASGCASLKVGLHNPAAKEENQENIVGCSRGFGSNAASSHIATSGSIPNFFTYQHLRWFARSKR